MQLKSLKLKNFRNHKDLLINFEGGSVLIFGLNGSGKTNILESIHLLSTTKTLRADHDVDMISHDEKFLNVLGMTGSTSSDEEIKLELTIIKTGKGIKKVKVNNVPKTLQKFSGILKSVIFIPSDIDIFSAAPFIRRRYVDSILYQTDSVYKREHLRFSKALKQRNKILCLINETGKGKDQLEFWDNEILESGKHIQNLRDDLFNYLTQILPKYAFELNGKNFKYEVVYKKSSLTKERLDSMRQTEIAAKQTLFGPHRDDLDLELDGYKIATFGSRGQQRSTLLSLKLCEIDFITHKTGVRPILLLDDIFSELDENHREAVAKILPLQQTIITTSESIEQIRYFPKEIKQINLD